MADFTILVRDGNHKLRLQFNADRLSVTALGALALDAIRQVETANMPGRVTVRLVEHGLQKINCIKTLRSLFDMDLRQAKDASETPNNDLVTTADAAFAKRCVEELRSIGAVAELRAA